MKKNLEELIKIQREIIPNFDEELFILEEKYLDKFGVYPIIKELEDNPTKETIDLIKERLKGEIDE